MDSLKIDTHLLIKSIKKRNPLYDSSAREYHDRALKKKLWDEVSSEVYSSTTFNAMSKEDKLYYGREIQKRWASLRHCFRRELSAQKIPNSTTNKTHKRRKKYEYFDALSFLSSFSENGDVENSPKNEPESEPVEVLVEIDNEAVEYSSSEPDTDVIDEPVAKIQKINESQVIDISFDDQVDRTDKDRGLTQNDDDGAFFLSLMPTMKEFTVDQKLLLRIEIMKTIVNFKKRHFIE